jgi:fructose-1,6-bisphosphatase II
MTTQKAPVLLHRSFTIESVRCTEGAAIAAYVAAFIEGCRDKNKIDERAVYAMHQIFNTELQFDCEVVFGEGTWDGAPMLYPGEHLGVSGGPVVHIGVDPIDGTSNTRDNLPGATSVLAASYAGGLMAVPDELYLRKLAVGPGAKGEISLEVSFAENLKAVAAALKKPVKGLTVAMLNRGRNQPFLDACQQAGCQVLLLNACDIVPGIATAFPEKGVDIMVGSGGAPEAVILAAALKCVGGDMCAQFMEADNLDKDEAQRQTSLQKVPRQHLTLNDLVPGTEVVFAVTGVTDNLLCHGITYDPQTDLITTDSRIFRSPTGTIREMKATRKLSSLPHLLSMR